MKKTFFIIFLIVSCAATAQQANYKDAFLEKWSNSRDYLIAVAEAMPQEHYNFKPTERQKSFKEQLLHIQSNASWLSSTYFKTETDDANELFHEPENKEDMILAIKETFDRAYELVKNTPEADYKTTVEFFAGPKSKLQIMNLMQDHVTHHRGQLMLYLNLKNITPPNYSGW